MSRTNSARNSDGIWINTNYFREAAIKFIKDGYYCAAPAGSTEWFDFWKEERRRCIEGYSVGGCRITGDHYFYLNYCPIMRLDIDNATKKNAKKIKSFADFWDGDYNYFWCREIARSGILDALNVDDSKVKKIMSLSQEDRDNEIRKYYDSLHMYFNPLVDDLYGGKDLIVGKSRRRGFSYKNSAVATCNYFHRPNSYTMFMAFEKTYLYPGAKTVFYKCRSYINFINEHTAWSMPNDYIDKQNHIRASYKEYDSTGKSIEKGFFSEIEAISFNNNPDAGRGSDAYDIFGEEVGAWGTPGGLKDSVNAMRSSTEAGSFKTGMITLYGTSGDVEGGTADFSEMFNNPGAWNFMRFHDVWGEDENRVEGFFFPKSLNTEGFYDSHGNSDIKRAIEFEQAERKKMIDGGATSNDITHRLQEEPLNSQEAFSLVSQNIFPKLELQRHLNRVISEGLQFKKGTCVEMTLEDGMVKCKPIMQDIGNKAITKLRLSGKENLEGCPVIYEYPVNDPPFGLYKIGYDPYRQDRSTGDSLASILVWKGVYKNSYDNDMLVAEYHGRPDSADDASRIALMFAILYNTEVMYENEVTHVKTFFQRNHYLNRLALQPDRVISKNVKNSKVNRIYGCHMNEVMKDAGEKYIKDSLVTIRDFDEEGNKVLNLEKIYSIRMLESLISYSRNGNFDAVMALMQVMFQVQEEELGKVYGDEKESTIITNDLKKIKLFKRK